jgi:AhpD family alkylhydroperoxidase
MAHRPEVLKNFVPLYGAIMGPGSVSQRVKELVYLTCSYANQCAFCTAAHTASAPARPASPMTTCGRSRPADEQPFSAAERAAIAYARDLTRTATAGESREALFAHFTPGADCRDHAGGGNGQLHQPVQQRPADSSGSLMPILSGIHPVAEALRAKHPLERLLVAQGRGRPAFAGTDRPGAARGRAGAL